MDFLFISASFFGYQKDIISKLESSGRKVMWFEDRPATDNLTKALIRGSPQVLRAQVNSYFDNVIAQASAQDIREVLVIKGEALAPHIILKMRLALPRARFTLYFWDSYRNMPRDSAQKVAHFDKAFSFDPVDVINDPRLVYRPLFYTKEYSSMRDSVQDIDVLFLGTIHSDRYEVIKRISKALPPELSFERVMYMPSDLIYWTSKLFNTGYWTARKSEFIFQPVARSQVVALLSRSRIVIDVERAVQTGYTMRTIEMLGASKKLITTNPRIEDADFFKPSNQLCIDRNKITIPDAFLSSQWQTVDPSILHRYSIDGWLNDILG